jgi:hypothetical protein
MVAALSLKEKNPDTVNAAIRELQNGRDNASGTVTLAVSPATTTTVAAPNCSSTSGVQLTPATLSAAVEWGNKTMYVPTSAVAKGQFTITHSANAAVDRTFFYRVHGGN